MKILATLIAAAALTLGLVPLAHADPPPSFGSGLYLVGTDIPAGTYHTNGPDDADIMKLCIWQRKKDDSGSFASIKSSNMVGGPNTVTAQNGEYLQLTGCTWTKR